MLFCLMLPFDLALAPAFSIMRIIFALAVDVISFTIITLIVREVVIVAIIKVVVVLIFVVMNVSGGKLMT